MIKKEFRTEFKNSFIENQDFNLGLTINSVGYKSIISTSKDKSSENIVDYKLQFKKGVIRNEFKLIYITKGNGLLCFENSNQIEISEGKILLVYPQQSYEYYHTELEWKEYYIRFEADNYYYQLIKEKFDDKILIIDFGYNDELIALFTRAMDVVRLELSSSQAYLSGMLFHALGLIIAVSLNKTQNSMEFQKTEKAKIIMNESILEAITIPEIALKINTSYSSFRSLFKKHTGIAPAKYFNELKLKKAKQLLAETSYSVKEIACMFNPNNPDHFYTFFKKNTGYTPTKYRTNSI